MFWATTELKLSTEYCGEHTYCWIAEVPDSVMPVSGWEFLGSHRNFDHVYDGKGYQ